MVLTGILAGLRVGEILGLRWEDVDLDAKQIRIEQAVYRGAFGSPKTKGSRRTVPVPEPLALALESLYEASQLPNGLVFPTRTGNPPQRLQPAQPASETGRKADRSSMAQLAHVPAHPCHSAVAGRSVSSRCCGSAGTCGHWNDNEHLHAADPGSPAGSGRKGRSGDESRRVCHIRQADSPAYYADSASCMVGAAGFEPTTSTVRRWHSTAELCARHFLFKQLRHSPSTARE